MSSSSSTSLRQSEPQKKTKVLFVGGSNTILKNGYYGQTVKALAEYFDLDRVDDRAIGGTTMAMGLWSVLNLKPDTPYDLIFIEYCINDYALTKSPEKFANWHWAFNAVLNHLRRTYPQARIYPLLFGRRHKKKCAHQIALFTAIRTISANYHAHPIPVDEYVHSLLSDDQSDASLYSDESHYAVPIVSSLIANYITRVVFTAEQQVDLALHAQNSNALPAPVAVQHCDHSLFSPLGEIRNFKNSRYDLNAVALVTDGPWQEITIPGGLVQLNYISALNSARLIVAEEGEEPVAFDTLHQSTASGKFSFLIRNFFLTWKQPPTGKDQPRTLALRAVSSKKVAGEDFNYVKQYHMISPLSPETNNAVYLCGALFS